MQQILITGANGQIGSDLVKKLRSTYGNNNVVGTDLKLPGHTTNGPHEIADVTNLDQLREIITSYKVDTIFHLASILSVTGEKHPDLAWKVNLDGLKNVLDIAVSVNAKVFWPSSIAVFGPTTPKFDTPQRTILEPETIYGITKSAGELLCNYYHQHFGVDVRSVRYPGLISYAAPPGGGTTDFTIDMLRAAAAGESYTCFVGPETRLPMMYMPDAVQASLQLMEADGEKINIRTSYNIASISFSAAELAAEIRKTIPDFSCTYEPDFRQEIADSWPSTLDDANARHDWNWHPDFSLQAMVEDMLLHLKEPSRVAT
ncbi:MAG: NAD-dependent epimerase/dehydratase family protein [Rhodothermales bacterium]